MKVSELIAELQDFDPDLEVALRGYEGGIYFPDGASKVEVLLNVHSEWYYGPNEIVDEYYGDKIDTYTRANCVLIGQIMMSLVVFTVIFVILVFVGYKTWQEIKNDPNYNNDCNGDCNQGRSCNCDKGNEK